MLAITKPSDNRVDIEISGSIDAAAMQTGLDTLIEQSETVVDGRMLYTITNFSMPTMSALAVELKRLPKLFGLLSKYNRCAVVSDTGWLRKAAEVEGALIPGLTIKSFDIDDTERAEEWLTGD